MKFMCVYKSIHKYFYFHSTLFLPLFNSTQERINFGFHYCAISETFVYSFKSSLSLSISLCLHHISPLKFGRLMNCDSQSLSKQTVNISYLNVNRDCIPTISHVETAIHIVSVSCGVCSPFQQCSWKFNNAFAVPMSMHVYTWNVNFHCCMSFLYTQHCEGAIDFDYIHILTFCLFSTQSVCFCVSESFFCSFLCERW